MNFKLVFILVFMVLLQITDIKALENNPKALALVNSKVITSYDVKQRIQILNLLGKNLVEDSLTKKYVLQNLIDEELFFYETKRLKVTCDDYDIKKYIENLSKIYGLDQQQSKILFQNQSFLRQVRAQLLWNKLLGMLFSSRLKISQEEINTELSKKKYQILSVFIKQVQLAENDNTKVQKLKSANVNCQNFDAFASSIGLNENSSYSLKFEEISPYLQEIISKMTINQISEPIIFNDQAIILMLCDKKVKEIAQNPNDVKADLFEGKLNFESAKYLKELKKRVRIEYLN